MFDQPVFKILARNDTGSARGHQGGMVIPKDLEDYLPDITGITSPLVPTADQKIEADLFLNGEYRGTVSTRYQYQTWGGQRSPERRLTGNLGPIRDFADAGDVLLIERSVDDPLHYRLSIETAASPRFVALKALTGSRSWGALRSQLPPAGNSGISEVLDEIEAAERTPLILIDPNRATSTSLTTRKIRDQAFRRRLVTAYGRRCAISGISLDQPPSATGLDAAHIVPVEAGGSDDPRNGLLLSKDLHWAFDNGLLHIAANRRVVVPDQVRAIPSNEFLRQMHDRLLVDPNPAALRASPDALAWHRDAAMQKLAARA